MGRTSGGRVSTVINGVVYHARGVITLDPSNIEVSAGANQDGTIYRTVAPRARMAECTFDRLVDIDGTPLRWAENIMATDDMPVTFVEDDATGGLTHILNGAFFVGKPSTDLSTGEVSGLSIAAQNYKTVT